MIVMFRLTIKDWVFITSFSGSQQSLLDFCHIVLWHCRQVGSLNVKIQFTGYQISKDKVTIQNAGDGVEMNRPACLRAAVLAC